MKNHLLKASVFVLLSAALVTPSFGKGNFFGTKVPEQPQNPALDPTKNTALLSLPKLEDDGYDWMKRHEAIVALGKTVKPKIVLLGDSITHFWGGTPEGHPQNGPESWQKTFGATPVLNLGFGWDRTQNVLWRIDHGEFDTIRPKVVILNIGTNNFTATANARANTPEEVAKAILEICSRIRAKSFQTKIIVMGVFPRGFEANSETRAPITALNGLLARSLSGKMGITFLNIGTQFLLPDGSLNKELMADDTHPNENGYAIWASALIKAGVLN